MLSFRSKILIGYLLVLLILLTLLFPFATHTVHTITRKALKNRAKELIAKISNSPNLETLIKRLGEEQYQLFYRVSLLDSQGHLLYDPHAVSLIGEGFKEEYVATQQELQQALEEGTGYNEEFSSLMGLKLIYVARAFEFQHQTLILRTAFPFNQVTELVSEFEIGFLLLASIVLILFSIMTWTIFIHLSKPIQEIIRAVKPYQEGKAELIPKINLTRSANSKDDFVKLADTLNSLSERIQSHINSLTLERNNKEIILESLREGVIAVDSSLKITYANRISRQMLHMSNEELVGHLFSDSKLQSCQEILQACLKYKTVQATTLQITDPKRIFLDVLAVPVNNNNGALLVLQDKSSHYLMIESGKDFIANASHELKTPITIIRGFAETLHDHPELPREIEVDITAKIVRNCKRMETIVKNLLTLADVERLPPSRLQECDLNALIQNCRQMILTVYPQAQIDVVENSDHPIYLIADPDLLEVAIMNLLDNAAKYSPSPAHITVTLNQQDMIGYINVTDRGIGIPSEDLGQVFNRFYTVDKAHSRKLGGAGLGLSIVQTIIEKHGGTISVSSTVGKGTSFQITIPVILE
jgi:signal transduction histidine kinase